MRLQIHQLVPLILTVLLLFASSDAQAQTAGRSADFNDDGYDDLVVGMPGRAAGFNTQSLPVVGPDNGEAAGAIRVIYGSQNGLIAAGSRLFRIGSPIPEDPKVGQRFGAAIAVGDFNGDRISDVAVGAPNDLVTTGQGQGPLPGKVIVIFGSNQGLRSDFQTLEPVVSGAVLERDGYGAALTAGDFDDDGFDELVIGAPGGKDSGGIVRVWFGSPDGLVRTHTLGELFLEARTLGLSSDKQLGIGSALTVGDFTGDGHLDLAIGVPGSFPRLSSEGGQVAIHPGSEAGLINNSSRVILIDRDAPGVAGEKAPGDRFGSALAAGDLDASPSDELIVGAFNASADGTSQNIGGGVYIFNAFPPAGASDSQFWHQDSPGVAGTAEGRDDFGAAVAAGQFNAGDFDVVVGVPNESLSGPASSNTGAAHVFYGPLDEAPKQLWHQDSQGLSHGVEEDDQFASALGTADFNGDGYQDLAIGVPGETILNAKSAGGVIVLYGSSFGLSTAASQFWGEHNQFFFSSAAEGDEFGAALSSAALAKANPIQQRPWSGLFDWFNRDRANEQ